MEEKSYSIYYFWVHWDQDDFKNNSTSDYIMFKEEPTEDQLTEHLEIYKKQIEDRKGVVKWLDAGYKYVEHETWCLKWFYHSTYNLFESDKDAIRSFDRFVQRKKKLNIQNEHYDGHNSDSDKPYHCLMGAEDWWRWEVCHCEKCKNSDWTVISH